MANQFSFFFGVELELLISSRSKSHKSWMSLATEVSTKLKKAGIRNHINEGCDKSTANYTEWSIVQEVTVPSQPGKNLWGIELVSPIFELSSPWSAHLSLIYKTLKSSFTLSSSANTSTHVHMSTSPPLPTSCLGTLAKAILYFEPGLDLLLPSSRGSSYWCQSNHENTTLKNVPLLDCFTHMDYCHSPTDIAAAMCSFPAKSAYGQANGFTSNFVHGVYKWDFSGLVDPALCLTSNHCPSGTIEYRQCPGSKSAEEAHTWLMLALGFVAGAMERGDTIDPQAPVAMGDLWWTVSCGLQALQFGSADLRAMEKLFSGKGK
ncbi:hypothetical protein PFICI_12766 [Pestalotiopsis fici W106-1]|uniref:Uncharacterized protein n=1 Tax=Pestalotiopsis fici (strain W106-1 / CGMCC3.15140) TaxID=1229662 RepID=W3WRR3_PESFW|nr:uncharacterized protein PFICI_12766 [Pestalotiopsis fici W106-1]ETS75822.1 hypothetical protein PFICI_12766 [Pestalotiopsis fici W106-1]